MGTWDVSANERGKKNKKMKNEMKTLDIPRVGQLIDKLMASTPEIWAYKLASDMFYVEASDMVK